MLWVVQGGFLKMKKVINGVPTVIKPMQGNPPVTIYEISNSKDIIELTDILDSAEALCQEVASLPSLNQLRKRRHLKNLQDNDAKELELIKELNDSVDFKAKNEENTITASVKEGQVLSNLNCF